MLKVAVTGSTGLVGSRIVDLLQKDFTFIPLLSSDFDITDPNAVNTTLRSLDFDLLLHLAAYTNVDKADVEKDIAKKLNVEATKNLLDATMQKDKKFIYFSTGFVFDGTNPPYDEDSKPNPINYYGETKYLGEQVVKDKTMIVRIEYPYRAAYDKKKDYVRVIKSFLEQGKIIQGIQNSFMTTTFIDDIAFGLKHLINNYSPEVFHLVGEALSPYDAAKLIAKTFNLDESLVQPTTIEKYFEGKAKRPQWAKVISKKNNFYKMKTFEEGLNEIKNMLQ